MNKISVDSAAKDYWTLLFGDYGTLLTRDVPRRIKAALFDNKKVACINESATIKPIAHAKSASGKIASIEGLYTDGAMKLMFKVAMDDSGEITDIKTIALR